jgi:hypothetical protein
LDTAKGLDITYCKNSTILYDLLFHDEQLTSERSTRRRAGEIQTHQHKNSKAAQPLKDFVDDVLSKYAAEMSE